MQDLDTLPYPAYDLIDMQRYWSFLSFTPVAKRRYVTMLTSRGCPYDCAFCHKQMGDNYRTHSAERVVEEIEYFRTTSGVDTIEIVDDAFNIHHKRVMEICHLITERNIKVHLTLPYGVRCDFLNQDSIDALVNAGMDYCAFPLESGSQRIRTIMNKQLDMDKALRNIELTAKRRFFLKA